MRKMIFLALIGLLFGCAASTATPGPSSPTTGSATAAPDALPPGLTSSDEQWMGRSIYFLLTDRFANGDPSNDDSGGSKADRTDPRRWHGGDFQGVINNLDYIKGMGFGAIWITPVTMQRSPNAFHGYWQYDLYQIDPHLGSLENLRELVAAAHERDLLVMIDVVPNHTGDFIPGGKAAPPFDDPTWYHGKGDIKNYGNQQEVEQGDLLGLDDLNQENPATRAELLKWIDWLREQTGLDGLRIDTAKHLPKDFLKDFDAAANTHTMGEVFSGDVGYVAPYTQALDAVVDFPFYEASKKALRSSEPLQNIQRLFQSDGLYRNVHTNGTFLDNHDVERFLCTATGGPNSDVQAQLKQALAVQFTVRGLPIVYYGTEQEFKGCKDPTNREDLFDSIKPDSPIYQWLAKLNTIRAAHPALQRGESADRFIDAGGWAFQRTKAADTVVVCINNLWREQEFEASGLTDLPNDTTLTDALGGGTVTIRDGTLMCKLAAKQVAVYGR